MDKETNHSYDSQIIGSKIQTLRKERGWTQEEFGALLDGLKQSSITNLENGRNQISKMEFVEKLLDVFEITFDYLFEDVLNVFTSHKTNEGNKGKFENQLKMMDESSLLLLEDIISILLAKDR